MNTRSVLAGGRVSFKRSCLVVGAAVPAAVLARVVVDVIRDPTSHNLWPFEAIIAAAVGLALALPGALLGRMAARVFNGGSG